MRLIIVTIIVVLGFAGITHLWAETAKERKKEDIRYETTDATVEDNPSDIEVRNEPSEQDVRYEPTDATIENNSSDIEVRDEPSEEYVRDEPNEDE
jgi:hypothetical protein